MLGLPRALHERPVVVRGRESRMMYGHARRKRPRDVDVLDDW